MTISNETKVGALTAIAITLLILGSNFLKGKSLSAKNIHYFAVFQNIQGLTSSNPVVINGKEVGKVQTTDGGKDMRNIVVDIRMKDDVNIPTDAYAAISKSLLGNVQLEIMLGNSNSFLKSGDTIKTNTIPDPLLTNVGNAAQSLDKLLASANGILDTSAKGNIREILMNLNRITASLAITATSLQSMMNTQSGALAKTLNNANTFTEALNSNNEKISATMGNVQTATEKFARLDIEKTLTLLNSTVNELKTTIAKVNSNNGTLGLMMNDTRLYNNLNATSNKLNLLLDDIRVHPKRYINVSVFGKKDKSVPLTEPLPDTLNAPYIRKQ
jgi:phospholipid/cholesterol/gamma-HCH transport system substrate-binding protein